MHRKLTIIFLIAMLVITSLSPSYAAGIGNNKAEEIKESMKAIDLNQDSQELRQNYLYRLNS